MTARYKSQLDAFIETVKKNLEDGAGDPALARFVPAFLSSFPIIEMESFVPAEAAELAQVCFSHLKQPFTGEPRIVIDRSERRERPYIILLNQDMPYLVDSISAALRSFGLTLEAVIHPILSVRRSADGTFEEFSPDDKSGRGWHKESLIFVELSLIPPTVRTEIIAERLELVLQAVRLAHADKQPMLDRLDRVTKDIGNIAEAKEVTAFLKWLKQGHFIWLGYVEYRFDGLDVHVVPESEAGIMRLPECDFKPKGLLTISKEALVLSRTGNVLELSKSSRISPVHRPAHMDYVSIRRFDAKGNATHEYRFIGLYAPEVYLEETETIPIIRRKVAAVFERSGFDPMSFNGKRIRMTVEFLPRDELLQFSEDELYDLCMGVVALETHPMSLRLFTRRDVYGLFLSCLVYIPKEYFTTPNRLKIQSVIQQAFHAQLTTHYTQVTDAPHARLHLILQTLPGQVPEVDIPALQKELTQLLTPWEERLHESLAEAAGPETGEALYHEFSPAFPADYQHRFEPATAVADVMAAEAALRTGQYQCSLEAGIDPLPGVFTIKTFNAAEPDAPLSLFIPILENMGLTVIHEHPYHFRARSGGVVGVREFVVTTADRTVPDLDAIRPLFQEALLKIWQGEVESDAFNQLILNPGLSWRQVLVLRAYSRYLRQAGFTYSHELMASVFARNPRLARLVSRLFETRFSPEDIRDRRTVFMGILAEIEHLLADVTNADDDRVMRRYTALIQATLRTNYFQQSAEGEPKPYISFKFDGAKVPELPLPRPYAEIFVYSARFEGVHLRGGRVARGGLRWSDRREDYRTEILGLVKAQMVKNAVIVPVGAKGGFVLKQALGMNRDAYLQEGVTCYKMYLRGLLDITDNLKNGKVVPPANVVRHDKDDPYLVVAADKGTATFSDYANGVSAEYGFWLGDAFASGGSAGYDHKEMGITARGGWISVVRHFREMGMDPNKDVVTVVGIGDMAGDVFGNGLLMSDTLKLVAAFNHLHIFIDPDPDPAKSFKERKRLFETPRITWADYNPKLISKGGGVFERKAKSIPVSPEMKARFAIKTDTITPDELIKAVLCSPVDLLWNGGIGTFVKAGNESHEEVGDRANNTIRVNGKDLRCKVVGEGGNLGFTQQGRIEYARSGGRINTDAIDNSAGVDCSDHEVNIKIALSRAMTEGVLDVETRNTFLESMTDEVARLVLRDNQLQTQAISISAMQGMLLFDSQERLMHHLERQGLLDRALEFLPSDEALAERRTRGAPLTRPELAVLLGYSKIALYNELLSSDFPDDPYLERELFRYFPTHMQEQYPGYIKSHALRREIIATASTNSIINRVGSDFINQISEDTGLSVVEVARAYCLTREVFDLRTLWGRIEGMDGQMPAETQVMLFNDINDFVRHQTFWFLRNAPHPLNLGEEVARFQERVKELETILKETVTGSHADLLAARIAEYTDAGTPEDLAEAVARLTHLLLPACDLITAAAETITPLTDVCRAYFDLQDTLRIGTLLDRVDDVEIFDYWTRLGIQTLVQDIYDEMRRMTVLALEKRDLAGWLKDRSAVVSRYRTYADELAAASHMDMPLLLVAHRRLQAILHYLPGK